MAIADDDPLCDLADNFVPDSLQHPDNLREFLEQAVPDLAPGFDCTRARFIQRDFPMEDWRRREADLPFEIPYRIGDQEVWALVCVFIEHQSDTDPLMPLRLLLFAVLYWNRQWKEWQESPTPRPPLKLRPVLPIVLYTGAIPWGSNRTIVDLLGEPTAFHAFAPAWQPLFWNLADRTPKALLKTGRQWLQTLAGFLPLFQDRQVGIGFLHPSHRAETPQPLDRVALLHDPDSGCIKDVLPTGGLRSSPHHAFQPIKVGDGVESRLH
jgi:hypothetical protein